MSDAVALAIKVTTDANDATAGLDDTSSKLDSVRDSAKGAASVAGQTGRAIGGLAKGFSLIGADGAAAHLKEVQQGLGFVKGALGVTSLATSAYTAITGTSTGATIAKTVAEKAGAVGSGIMTAAQWALNAALSANPVALIVIGLIALVAVIILAYKKSDTFRAIVNAAFSSIAKTVSFVVDFIRDHWKLLLVILGGPIGLAVALIASHFDKVKAAALAVIGWVQDHWPAIRAVLVEAFTEARNKITDVIDTIKGAISTAKSVISTAMDGVRSAVQTVVDAFQAVLEKIQAVIDKVQAFIDKVKGVDLNPFGRVAAGSGSSAGGLLAGTGLPGKEPLAGRGDVHFHFDGFSFIGDEATLARKFREMLADDLVRLGIRT